MSHYLVMLCCRLEMSVQMLEDNQVLVQGMMANRYMNTFRDLVLGWNKKLMAVADVVAILTEIQRTWAYLESLFVASEEVKKELPEATLRFAKIDADVKSVLAEFKKVQNCVACCGKDGLLKFLEKQQSELEVSCWQALGAAGGLYDMEHCIVLPRRCHAPSSLNNHQQSQQLPYSPAAIAPKLGITHKYAMLRQIHVLGCVFAHRCVRKRLLTTWRASVGRSHASTSCQQPTCWTSYPTATTQSR